MMYLKYAFAATLAFLFTLLTWVLCIPLAFTADKDGNLPNWLSWFQTFDATLDAGWKDGYAGYKSWMPLWFLRAMWLARNPGYGFEYWALGMAYDYKAWTVQVFEITDDHTKFYATAPGAFNYLYLCRWYQLKFGWKAWNCFDNDTQKFLDKQWGPAKRIPLCFTIVPRFGSK